MRKVSILGVLLGAIVDIVSSLLLGAPIAFYAASRADLSHVPPEQISEAIKASMHSRVPLYAAQLAMGLVGSILGGVTAAGVANREELLNGGLSSFLCIIMGIVMIASGKDSNPLWHQLLMLVASAVFALLGGALVRWRRHRRRIPASH
jgi:hypothetical protein